MPAAMRLRSPSIESQAGPSVQTSLARRNADMDAPRIVALVSLAPSTLDKAHPINAPHTRFVRYASALRGRPLRGVPGYGNPFLRLRSRRHGSGSPRSAGVFRGAE